MVDLSDLIARVEAASGPDRCLDVDICVATAVICDSVKPDEVSNLRVDPDDAGWVLYDCNGSECTDTAPEFTASIDAALTLLRDSPFVVAHAGQWASHMPRAGKPIFEAVIPDDTADYEITMIGDMIEIGPSASAATPALALLAAILKARQAKEARE